MLDLFERMGINCDSFDSGQSMRLHGWLFPNAKPQSICSRVVDEGLWPLAWLMGIEHTTRSWWRYNGDGDA